MAFSAEVSTSPLTQDERVAPDARTRAYKKVAIYIIPFLMLCYFICRIDTAVVGYAKLEFVSQLGFTEAMYGFGAGVFYLGYALCELPSNLYLQRFGIRRTLLRIMVLWGFVTMGMLSMRNSTEFYVLRFLLGVAEGGFLPGIMLYLTYWFPPERKARAYSFFIMANPVAGVVGGLMSGWIMKNMAGTFGLAGWQVLFLFMGLPAVVAGISAYFILSDGPGSARWLTDDEKELIEKDIAITQAPAHSKASGLHSAMRKPKVYYAAITYYAVVSTLTMFTVWGPSIIRSIGLNDIGMIGLVTSIPYVFGLLGLYFFSRSSDRLLEREWHFALGMVAAGGGLFLLCALHSNPYMAVACLCLTAFGLFGAYGVFFAIPTAFLSRSEAPAGIAIITTVGNVSGFFMPWMAGAVQTRTNSIYAAIAVLAFVCFVGAVLCLTTLRIGSEGPTTPKLAS